MIAKNLIDEAEEKSGRKLKHRDIVAYLLLKAAEGKNDLFEELVFTAKFLSGLIRAVGKQNFTNADVLNKELAESIIKIKKQIKELSEDKFPEIEKEFFQPDGESFTRLTELISDLEIIKLYLNDMKRGD
jgi:hypothetical protein